MHIDFGANSESCYPESCLFELNAPHKAVESPQAPNTPQLLLAHASFSLCQTVILMVLAEHLVRILILRIPLKLTTIMTTLRTPLFSPLFQMLLQMSCFILFGYGNIHG